MLTVRVSLILGDFLYDQHAVALRLRRTLLPALDRLEVVLPANVTLYARPGDDCRLEIDGGDGSGAVFSGRVSGIRRTLTAVRITAHNGGIALARYRPNLTLEQLSIGDVITSLCADSDVDIVANVEGAMLALYIAEGRATAAEEVARLARLAGAAGGFDGEGRLHVSEEGGRGGELALRYGREILACSVEENLADTNVLTVVGEGAGAPASDGRWITTDFLQDSSVAGLDARHISRPELRSKEDTEFAAAALTQQRSSRESPVRLRTWLHPALEPGQRLELADMPESVPVQECRIRQIVSTIAPDRDATTEIWASGQVEGASAFGDLLGALGGLL